MDRTDHSEDAVRAQSTGKLVGCLSADIQLEDGIVYTAAPSCELLQTPQTRPHFHKKVL